MPIETLQSLSQRLTTVPEGFKLHARAEKVIADRRAMGEGKLPLDWGMGETLGVRDAASTTATACACRARTSAAARSRTGTRCCTTRTASGWDTGAYIPLQHLKDKQPSCEIIDSVLTEQAVLGFEYGYSTSDPTRLVVWEAQFGDFVNGAQVVIDQFISAGEVKWGRICGLVMLLPHGYEGQGPEHSSARPERFLQLCAQHNMQVCVPSTPAQVFHMLRRQMLRRYRKPLIVMSPKSLLRHKEAVSSLEDLANGEFQTVIGETEKLVAKKVTRVLACSGKVYYELLAYRREHKIDNIAIVRLEQQYPFPHAEFTQGRVAVPAARRRSCGCRKSRRTRARGIACAPTCARTRRTRWCSRTRAAPSRRRRRSATRPKHLAEQKQLVEDAFAPELKSGEMVVAH